MRDDLKAVLVHPIQNIARCPLYLERLLQHTPKLHPDHSNLTQALQQMKALCERLNNEGRNEERFTELFELVQLLPT